MSGAGSTVENPYDSTAAIQAGVGVLKVLRSPIRGPRGELRTWDLLVDAGTPLAQALPRNVEVDRVIWNGIVVPRELYDDERVVAGEEYLVIPKIGITTSILIGAAISLIVGIAVSAISYYLFRPTPPKIKGPEEPALSFSGIRTTRGPGAVIPVVYGRMRVGGQLISASVEHQQTYVDNGEATFSVAITNVTGGVPTTSEYESPSAIIITAANHGVLQGTQIVVTGVLGKTGANGTWIAGVLDANTILLASSEGVDGNAYTSGGLLTVPSGNVARDVSESAATLNMLIALSEGEIDAVETATIRINNQPIGNFPDVLYETRTGTSTQTPISWMSETANTIADGREITADPGITYTTTTAVNAFVLNLTFNEGLGHISRNGERENNYVDLRYRFRVPAGAWSDYRQIRINGNRLAPVHFAIRRENLATSVYEVNVQFVHARVTQVERSKWKPYLSSFTQIVAGAQAYPHTALLALRSIATSNLQGDIPNVTVVIRGVKVRVGGLSVARTYSNDNAWCLLDILTHPRYGMKVPDAEMDMLAFQVLSNYCNEVVAGERRHTLNYVIQQEARAQDVLLEMQNAGRFVLFKSAGLWTPRVTRDDLPVQPLSWANCSNVQIQYLTDPERVNVLEGQFANETNDNFDTDVLTWPLAENHPVNVRKSSVQLPGITSQTRVMRALQYQLNQIRLPRVMLTCDAALDAMVLQPHSIFRFSHPLPGWGKSGRIVAATTTTLTVDEDVTFHPGLVYHCYVRNDDDAYVVRAVVNPASGSPVVTRTVSINPGTPLPFTPTSRTALWAVGESVPIDTAARLFRVVSLRRNNDQTVHIEAIHHNPSIYDEPTATPLPVVSDLPNPAGQPPPLMSLIATELFRIGQDGRSRVVVNLAWDVMPFVPGYGYGFYGGAIIYRRELAGTSSAGQAILGQTLAGGLTTAQDVAQDFVRIGSVLSGQLEFDDALVITGATYEYRVVPISQRLGVPNINGARQTIIHVTGPTIPSYYPPAPSNIRLVVGVPPAYFASDYAASDYAVSDFVEFVGRDAGIAWDPVNVDELYRDRIFIEGYRVEIHGPGSMYVLRGSQHITSTQYTYTYEQNAEDSLGKGFASARRQFTFKVWTRTTAGQESLAPATLTVANPPPDMSSVLPAVSPTIEGLFVDWSTFIEPRDIAKYDLLYGQVGGNITVYTGVAQFQQSALLSNLDSSLTYSVQIVPYDTFGPGVPSGAAFAMPLSPADRWRFFVREFDAENIIFSTDPVANSVTWTSGTLHYVDDSGIARSAAISGNTVVWTPATTMFIYYVLGETAFRTSLGIVEALGARNAIMAIYNGGTALLTNYGKALVHGSDIIANTVGANQLVVANAVITQSVQIANAIVTNAHIQNLAADKISAGTITALMVMAGLFQTPLQPGLGLARCEFDEFGFRIYDVNGNVVANLHRNGYFQLGYQSGASLRMDQGSLDLFDTSSTSVFRLQNVSPLVRIGKADGNELLLDNAGSLKPFITPQIAVNAVSVNVQYDNVAGFPNISTTELQVATITLDLSQKGQVIFHAKAQVDVNSGELLEFRMRVDSVAGTELDFTTTGDVSESGTANLHTGLMAVYDASADTGLRTFLLTAKTDDIGDTISLTRIKFVAIHLKR